VSAEAINCFRIEYVAPVFGHEDQMRVHGEDTMPARSQALIFSHSRPQYKA
jgi:hypothetical protein